MLKLIDIYNSLYIGKLERKDLFIVTKVPLFGNQSIGKYLEESLKNLGLDYVDLYLIHGPFSMKENDVTTQFKFRDGEKVDKGEIN